MAFQSCFVHRARGALAVAAWLGATASHGAPIPVGVRAETQALEWLSGGPTSADSDQSMGLLGVQVAGADAAFAPGVTSTTTSAEANYRYLEVITQTVGTYTSGASQLLNAQAISHASFREDSVVVEAPGFGPGDFGAFTALFQITHVVEFLVDVVSSDGGVVDITGGFQLEVIIGDATPGPYGGIPWTYSSISGSSAPSIPSGLIAVPVNFEYGVPFTIGADLEINLFTSLFGDISADIDALMNLGSAFWWQGIDTSGLPEGVTITSEHVRDWTVPYIPSPATILVPLAAAGALRRRR